MINVRARQWWMVWLIALGTRLGAAFLLPDAELDSYSYAEEIAQLSAKLSSGTFHLRDLFGFWLPLFQFAAALLDLVLSSALLAGKLISAISGALSCVLVFALAEKLTRSACFAWLAFALVITQPLHILFSASGQTDIPHVGLILAAVWFVVQRRWLVAAIFGALAEGVRVEAWVLIFLLPLLQLIYERKISIVAVVILLLPPLAWLGLNKLATGNWLAFLAERARYAETYLDLFPTRRGFAFADVWQDTTYFLIGANLVVFAGLLAAAVWLIRLAMQNRALPDFAPFVISAFALSIFGFFAFAYITKRQNVIIPRYGLVFFTLGAPVFVWILQNTLAQIKIRWLARTIMALAFAFCLKEAIAQCAIVSKVVSDFHAHDKIARRAAQELSAERDAVCFTDDPAVRVLSGLPRARFLRSKDVPPSAALSAKSFDDYLHQRHVGYLAFLWIEDSLPVKLHAELESDAPPNAGSFAPVDVAFSSFGPPVRLYRVREDSAAP